MVTHATRDEACSFFFTFLNEVLASQFQGGLDRFGTTGQESDFCRLRNPSGVCSISRCASISDGSFVKNDVCEFELGQLPGLIASTTTG